MQTCALYIGVSSLAIAKVSSKVKRDRSSKWVEEGLKMRISTSSKILTIVSFFYLLQKQVLLFWRLIFHVWFLLDSGRVGGC